MPYPLQHRTQVRQRIIDSARRLFNRRGFDATSVSQIMRGAGLTHGGFYAYFRSKSELYVEVMNCFFTDPDWKNCWEGVAVDLSALYRPTSPAAARARGAAPRVATERRRPYAQ